MKLIEADKAVHILIAAMQNFYSRLYFILVALLLAMPVWAQKAPPAPIRLGTVAASDFADAPTDTTAAPAEYLCDYGTTKLVGSSGEFQLVFERTARLRINRKAGYGYATIRVPLYTRDGNAERFMNLRGNTYNLQNGRVSQVKLNADPLYREKVDKNHLQVSFTMPEVREGSIVEFSYTITSNFLFNLQDWQFEHSIPVRWSEYRTTIPQFYIYKTITHGYLPFAVKEESFVPYSTTYSSQRDGLAPGQESLISTSARLQRWVLKDAPGFRQEPYMTAPHDYMRSVHFELAGTDFTGHDYHDLTGKWPALWKALNEDEEFGKALAAAAPLATEAAALRAQYAAPKARAAAVLALVQRTVQYNGRPAVFVSQPLRRSVERHLGNAADVNLLLVQTLRAAGLAATPLLISTRDHGEVQTEIPVLSQFNYVAAHIALPGTADLLLDATEPQLALGLLPERCLNGQGCLANEAGLWVPLRPAARYVEYRTATLKLTEQGTLQGNLKMEYGGYAAVAARRSIRQSSEGEYLAGLRREWAEWQPSAPRLVLPDSLQQPVSVELALQLPADNPDAKQLYLPLLKNLDVVPHVFRSPERLYPVDFGMPQFYISVVTLTLPKGTTVQEMPASVTLVLPGATGQFQYIMVQPTPETVQVSAKLQLNKATYNPEEYDALRTLHERAAAKCAEMLVLRRL